MLELQLLYFVLGLAISGLATYLRMAEYRLQHFPVWVDGLITLGAWVGLWKTYWSNVHIGRRDGRKSSNDEKETQKETQ